MVYEAGKNQVRRVAGVSLTDFPSDVFPNWSILSEEKYYVCAPVDKLGDFAFHLRSHLTALILAGNPAISFLQAFHSPLITRCARIFSLMGLEEFFLTLIVTMIWLFDERLGKLLAILLSFGFFISGSLKVSLCLPRPPSPPAMEIGNENKDWAWPSNHALLGTAFPWFIWIYASKHYEFSLIASFALLLIVFTWNVGVSWARVYLGVHSPCDVLGGWTIGVLLLFVFSGFSDRLYDVYVKSSPNDITFFIYLYSVALFLLWIHPRSWPETQSYMEVVSVLSGAAAIWCGRIVHLGGDMPFPSLLESNPKAPCMQYVARFLVGFAFLFTVRIIVKAIAKWFFKSLYVYMDLNFYSYSEMCKTISVQPTKRYTNRMRFRPIRGQKIISTDDTPYDVDLPIKFIVYGAVGFMVGEGCPAIFSILGI